MFGLVFGIILEMLYVLCCFIGVIGFGFLLGGCVVVFIIGGLIVYVGGVYYFVMIMVVVRYVNVVWIIC